MSSLAAVQADGYYHPPEYDPEKHGSLNKYRGSHGALGARARKLHEGVLVVRFEMPFPVWCEGCGHLMDTGVRFNAEKKQVGMYHSTKIWSFTMRTPCCKTVLEIHTDPANAAYIVIRGGQKKKLEVAPEEEDKITDTGRVVVDPRASTRPVDAIGLMEKEEIDRRAAVEQRAEIVSLRKESERRWSNDVKRNRTLRNSMRKARKEEQERDKRRKSLGLPDRIRLEPETEIDRLRASAIHFDSESHKRRNNWRHSRRKIVESSIFSFSAMQAAATNNRKVVNAVSKRDNKISVNRKQESSRNDLLASKARRLDSKVRLRLTDKS